MLLVLSMHQVAAKGSTRNSQRHLCDPSGSVRFYTAPATRFTRAAGFCGRRYARGPCHSDIRMATIRRIGGAKVRCNHPTAYARSWGNVCMSIAVDVPREMIKNAVMTVPALWRLRLNRPRAGVRFTGSDSELRRYAFQGLEALRQITGDLRGRSICEIGPGDFLTSGLAMLAAGARSYTAIDRFAGDYSRLEGKEWYTGVHAAWPRIYPDLPWPTWLDADRFPEAYPGRVMTSGVRIESASDIGTFDIVCSFQVGEHVSDIGEFARSTAALLASGGIAVHRIDFGPHGVWRSYQDPLTFLRVPEPLWHAMGSARGTPNRRRAHEVEYAFQEAGLSVTLTQVERYPASAMDLGRLPFRYRQMPLESLLINAVTLVARSATS